MNSVVQPAVAGGKTELVVLCAFSLRARKPFRESKRFHPGLADGREMDARVEQCCFF